MVRNACQERVRSLAQFFRVVDPVRGILVLDDLVSEGLEAGLLEDRPDGTTRWKR